jgi:hypothetical protein
MMAKEKGRFQKSGREKKERLRERDSLLLKGHEVRSSMGERRQWQLVVVVVGHLYRVAAVVQFKGSTSES